MNAARLPRLGALLLAAALLAGAPSALAANLRPFAAVAPDLHPGVIPVCVDAIIPPEVPPTFEVIAACGPAVVVVVVSGGDPTSGPTAYVFVDSGCVAQVTDKCPRVMFMVQS